MRTGASGFEMMADHRCGADACSTCDLFLAIPDHGTPAFAAWQRTIRLELLADPNILKVCPDLVLWLTSMTDRAQIAATDAVGAEQRMGL